MLTQRVGIVLFKSCWFVGQNIEAHKCMKTIYFDSNQCGAVKSTQNIRFFHYLKFITKNLSALSFQGYTLCILSEI